MSSDNSITQEIYSQEIPELPVSLKTWHRPVISRIEIAQTLASSGPDNGDTDNCQGS